MPNFLKVSRFALVLAIASCSAGGEPPVSGQIPADAPHQPIDLDGDGIPDGQQYDLDGDGRPDAVDLDGDGLLDGGDFDGDGKITLFTAQATGLVMATEEELAKLPEDVDPDFDANLADDAKGDGAVMQVMTRPSVDLSVAYPRPMSQGKIGSCAFTTAYLATGLRAQREMADPNTVWASPQFLYSRMLAASPGSMCKGGTSLLTGLAQLVVEGATSSAKLPYDETICAMDPPAEQASAYRIGSFVSLKFERDRIKEHLSAGHPIAIGTTLPENFMRWAGAQAKGVFKSVATQDTGIHGGGHAMVLIGYDDARNAYKIANSWGTDWGDGGFIWWDYADLEARAGIQAFAAIAYPEQPPAPTILTEAQLQIAMGKSIIGRNSAGDRLLVSAVFNTPVLVTRLQLDEQPAVELLMYFAHGALEVKSQGPLAAGMHTLTIKGGVAPGAKLGDFQMAVDFERKLTVMVGEPITDPDGR